MTEEEESAQLSRLYSLQDQYNALVKRYNSAVTENERLNSDCDRCQIDVDAAQTKVENLRSNVSPKLKLVEEPLQKEVGVTKDLLSVLDEIKEKYLNYKSAGGASKALTGLYEKYFTYFKNYEQLRQVSLAYIVGVDAHIWASDAPRKIVEETYLANTNYWLSYATMAVMLWASDEKTACERAIDKSMQMNEVKTSLFFLLVSLRFERIDTAKQWYKIYMNFVSKNAIGDELKYILQALLSGSFGSDKIFERQCVETMRDMFVQLHESMPNIDEQIVREINSYFDCFVSVTSKEFVHLRRNCFQFESLMTGLSSAEKNQILYDYFDSIFSGKIDENLRLSSKIEESLYQLINDYDDDEKVILDKIKFNELLVKAMGKEESAKSAYDTAVQLESKEKNLAIFMCDVALDYDDKTPTIVKKFAMKYISKYCALCSQEYGQSYIGARQQNYDIKIDGWQCNTDENGFEANKPSLIKHYNKMIKKEAKKDKTIKTSLIAMLATFMLAAIFLGLTPLNNMLVLGLSVGLISFAIGIGAIYIMCMQWQKIKRANEKLIQYGLTNLAETLKEIKLWKESFDESHSVNKKLIEIFK